MQPAPPDDGTLATDLHVQATYRLTEALVQAGEQMRRRIELLSEVVFETNAAGQLVFLNRAWQELVGRSPAECLGHPLRDYVLPEDWPLCERALGGGAQPGAEARVLIRVRRDDGAVKWAELSIDPIAGGGAVGAVRDVTLQKLAQDELARMSLVAGYTDNLVIITDRAGRTEWVNDAFVGRTGYTVADMAGRKPGEVLQGPDTDRSEVARIGEELRNGRSCSAEVLNYSKAGEPYWVQFQITPVRNAAGDVERFVAVQRDSTELRRAQQQLEHARCRAEAANEAKTRFLATISHEMRTPLNAILGSTDLALHGGVVPAELRSHLARIDDSGRVLMRLITDMLDMSKIEAGQVDIEHVPIDVRKCLECSLAPIADRARSKGLDFQVALDTALPHRVLFDPDRLRQIVANLADNAVKFTDAGFVRVEAGCRDAGEPDHVLMEIRVLDSGLGIPAEAREKIFDRFVQGDSSTTRRKGGAGLGLSIVKSLVEALGGQVSVRGRQGAGTEFRVTLPLATTVEQGCCDPGPCEGRPSGDVATTAVRPARILVAEDNDAGFAVLEAYLARAGHEVARAITGRDAVTAAAGCDLVLMDIEMPEMDGLEATRQIRALERERGAASMPIIALTAHALQEYRERCAAAGCSGYLAKPIRMQPLLDAVAAILDGRSGAQPAEPRA